MSTIGDARAKVQVHDSRSLVPEPPVPTARRSIRARLATHRSRADQPQRRRTGGQSFAEFAIIVPVLFLILLAIADLGRVYTSAVAVEAAAREAADYGAFDASRWDATVDPDNDSNMVVEMKRRACVAAKGSHLEGYAQTDPLDDTSCTNPAFTCTIDRGGFEVDCATSDGAVAGADCSKDLSVTDPPCTVHVRLDYSFTTFFAIPPMPTSIAIVRESRFRMSSLEAPTPP